jgi:hypothetical protein
MNKNDSKIYSEMDNIFCYNSKKFFILTLPKIASSWIHELFLKYKDIGDRPFDDTLSNNFNMCSLTLKIGELDNNVSDDVREFANEWENLINGKSSHKDFIFLMRDPIDKFVTGAMQDDIFNNFKINSSDILESLNMHSNKDELNVFWEFHKNQTQYNEDIEWWHDIDLRWPIEVYNVMSTLIDNIVTNWILNIDNLKYFKTGHKSTHLFTYYKILFISKIDKNKLTILDIDSENLGSFLKSKYNIPLNDDDIFKINPTTIVIKHMIKKSMVKHIDIINSVLSNDILLYCDLKNHLYSKKVTPDSLWYDRLYKDSKNWDITQLNENVGGEHGFDKLHSIKIT